MKDLKPVDFNSFVDDIKAQAATIMPKTKVYRFDIFRGDMDGEGKLVKKKNVGTAYLREGYRTYSVHVKTLLKDVFYILPNNKVTEKYDFAILTREPAQHGGKKYFWNNVGEGRVLDGPNKGIMALTWYFFDNELYMNLFPTSVSDSGEAKNIIAA
jgi:hypothetical protein